MLVEALKDQLVDPQLLRSQTTRLHLTLEVLLHPEGLVFQGKPGKVVESSLKF